MLKIRKESPGSRELLPPFLPNCDSRLGMQIIFIGSIIYFTKKIHEISQKTLNYKNDTIKTTKKSKTNSMIFYKVQLE